MIVITPEMETIEAHLETMIPEPNGKNYNRLQMEALKAQLKTTWMAGDYGHFAIYLDEGAQDFLQRLNLQPGTRLLDVACGTGQIAIPAARAGAHVTGVDIATNSIAMARARAQIERLEVQFDEGDAERLPYADGSFDLVVSLAGAMFALQPERVVAELLRVCRPGGRIVMGNWTPDSLVGQMFEVIHQHVPRPPLIPSPTKWGEEEVVRERLNAGVAELRMTQRAYPIRYPFCPAEVVEFHRVYFGPVNRAFASLHASRQAALRRDLEQLWTAHNRSTTLEQMWAAHHRSTYYATRCESEYLEVVAVRA